MIIFYGAGTVIFILLLYFIIATAISDGIVNFINENLPVIILIFFLIYLICLLVVFRIQKKEYKKVSWLTPLVSIPSFAQFFYFFIYGAICISRKNVIFSLFLIIGYIVWLIVSGFCTFIAQTCCIGLPSIHNKYISVGEKLLIIGLPLGVGIAGFLINSIIF